MNEIFFELMQVALGNRERLSVTLSAEDWTAVYEVSRKQALVGVAFYALQMLPKEQWPTDRRLLMKWAMQAEKIRSLNGKVTEECRTTAKVLTDGGLDYCVLKGQSLHDCYPEGLRMYRTPGDVDVWVKPFGSNGEPSEARRLTKKERRRIIDFAWKTSGQKELPVYHHIHCERLLKDNLVELHFTPSYSINPMDNARLQNVLDRGWKDRVVGMYGFNVMPMGLNLVFMLSHISRHVITEGIGLRQLLDYYIVLTAFCNDEKMYSHHGSLNTKEAVMAAIRHVGMERQCAAVMYVLVHVFGMSRDCLLCEPDEWLGRGLLEDIISGGNFGRSSERVTGIYSGKWRVVRFWRALCSSMRLIRYYPREILWVPYSSVISSVKKNYWRRKMRKHGFHE